MRFTWSAGGGYTNSLTTASQTVTVGRIRLRHWMETWSHFWAVWTPVPTQEWWGITGTSRLNSGALFSKDWQLQKRDGQQRFPNRWRRTRWRAEETGWILLLLVTHPPQYHSASNDVIPNCIISWSSYSSDRSDDAVSCLAEPNVIYLHLIFPKAIDRKIARKPFILSVVCIVFT